MLVPKYKMSFSMKQLFILIKSPLNSNKVSLKVVAGVVEEMLVVGVDKVVVVVVVDDVEVVDFVVVVVIILGVVVVMIAEYK